MPTIIEYESLVYSVLLVMIFAVVGCIPWYQILNTNQVKISLIMAIKSMGLFVFTKYIPGKIWVVVGRATWVSEQYRQSQIKTALISLQTQLLGLWVGLLTGTIGILLIAPASYWVIISFILLVLLGIVLFIPHISKKLESNVNKLFTRKVSIPVLKFSHSLKLVPAFIAYWVLVALSFMFLGDAIIEGGVQFSSALCFNFAAVIGVFAIIAPGGIGVREGVLGGCLILSGLSVEAATSLSIASRLWFLISELALFVVGIIIPIKRNF